jgi:O-antigen/teichoic acid export membrane protein
MRPPFRPRLARSGLLLLAATFGANALNALFHFVLARVLEPADYSLLASLLVLVLILSVPTLAVQATVAREVASALTGAGESAAGSVVRGAVRSLCWAGVSALVAGAILAYPLAVAVHVGDPLPVLATAAALAASLAMPPVWGALQGAERFGALGLSQLGWAALRLAAAAGLGLAGAGAAGALAGVALGTATAALLSAAPLRGLWRASRDAVSARLLTRYLGAAGIGFALFAALTSADLLAARLAFSPATAGAYAAASVGARTLLLVPTAVTTVLFPRVATLADPLRERRHLLAGLAATAAACGTGAAIMLAAPGPLMHLAFGNDYAEGRSWLGPLALVMVLYALVYVFLLHFLALGRTRYVALLGGALVLQLALFGALHGRPAHLIWVQVAVAATALAAAELLDRRRP